MKLYRLSANLNAYQTLLLEAEAVMPLYRRLSGAPLPPDLGPLPVSVPPKERIRPLGDFPGLTSHIPVFSPRAVEALGPLLAAAGEMAPLAGAPNLAGFTALNITRVVDMLDLAHSDVKRFSSSGRIMRILRYAFLPERLAGSTLFKLPQTLLQEALATGYFAAQAAAAGLSGMVFELLWTDDEVVLLCPYCAGIIEDENGICPSSCGGNTRLDSVWEVTLAELQAMEEKRCPHCQVRIRAWADPCPYCGKGAQRQAQGGGLTIV